MPDVDLENSKLCKDLQHPAHENEGDDSDEELSVADEVAADNTLDEIITEVNKEDTHTNVSAATPIEVSSVSVPQSTSVSSLGDVQALIAKDIWEKKNIPRAKVPHVQELGASIVPRIISNAPAQQLLDLLTTTIKNNLPQAVRYTLPGFNRRIRNAIKDEMPEVLNTSVLKPIDILVVDAKHLQTKVDRTSTDLHEMVRLVSRVVNLMDTSAPSANGEQQSSDASDGQKSSALVVHSTDEKPPSKKLKVVNAIPSIPNLVPLNSIRPIIFDSIPFAQFSANLFESNPSKYSSIPPPKMADKGKGIAQTSNDDALKQILPFM
ncbi:hypothetical protein Tco_1050908 [Tanacetum coccineum]